MTDIKRVETGPELCQSEPEAGILPRISEFRDRVVIGAGTVVAAAAALASPAEASTNVPVSVSGISLNCRSVHYHPLRAATFASAAVNAFDQYGNTSNSAGTRAVQGKNAVTNALRAAKNNPKDLLLLSNVVLRVTTMDSYPGDPIKDREPFRGSVGALLAEDGSLMHDIEQCAISRKVKGSLKKKAENSIAIAGGVQWEPDLSKAYGLEIASDAGSAAKKLAHKNHAYGAFEMQIGQTMMRIGFIKQGKKIANDGYAIYIKNRSEHGHPVSRKVILHHNALTTGYGHALKVHAGYDPLYNLDTGWSTLTFGQYAQAPDKYQKPY